LAEPKPQDVASTADAEEFGTSTVLMRPGSLRAAANGAIDDRAHYLVVVEGAEPGRRIELGDKALVFGRCPPADIVVEDSLVSRNHCRIGVVAGELFVTDLKSSNGTFIGPRRIGASSLVAPGERIAIGNHVLEHEWRSRREVEASQKADTDLDNAKRYVRALLPPPIDERGVRTDWVLQPSAKLGGDLFGYHFIDEHTFALYLLDVTGHGTDAAMHAVSVMNVLRQPDAQGVDARDPARMAAHLNDRFPMERHGGMLLSLWYGVFDLLSRRVAYTSAGHHAAYLVDRYRTAAVPLDVSNVLIGMMPGYAYRSATAEAPPGSSLYLFSDGVFEIEPEHGTWGLEEFVRLLTGAARPGEPESRRILHEVIAATGRHAFEDDFTLVVAALE
jgi:serine phosphatase RsbU (regulator of sigma subunit)